MDNLPNFTKLEAQENFSPEILYKMLAKTIELYRNYFGTEGGTQSSFNLKSTLQIAMLLY